MCLGPFVIVSISHLLCDSGETKRWEEFDGEWKKRESLTVGIGMTDESTTLGARAD